MAIYKLTPIDPTHPDWDCSTTKEPCFVKADDEQQARGLAEKKLFIAAKRNPGHDVPSNPWPKPDMVKVEEVINPSEDQIKSIRDLPMPWPIGPMNEPNK